MSKLREFLAGDRLEDVALFLSEDALDEGGKLADAGQRLDGGVVLIRDGETGRSLVEAGTGQQAMQFAKEAMSQDGEIEADLSGGVCPDADGGADEDHAVSFVFAFAEAQNEEVGGIYEEGDVIHAYAQCACGTSYSHKWVVGERELPAE